MTYYEDAAPGDFEDVTYSDTLSPSGNSLNWITNITGALASLALVAGIGYWGYELMMRDVSGIPIVRAVEGEMRVRPDDPGGDVAQHQGLSVNAVAAEGGAAAPAQRLVLAPQPVRLTAEDLPMDEDAIAMVQKAIADQATDAENPEVKVAAAADTASVDALVAALADGVTPIDATTEAAQPNVVPVALALDADASQAKPLTGLRASLRPRLRPQSLPIVRASASATSQPAQPAIDPDNLPAGTRLVQLGAFESVEVAQLEWTKISVKFQDLMGSKTQIVQQASSGGRTFYRLRALGFDDLSDARRFCSALVAEGTDCIPVVTR